MPTRNILEAPELETPRYKGQNVDSQWCPLWRGSTVYHLARFRLKPRAIDLLTVAWSLLLSDWFYIFLCNANISFSPVVTE